MGTGWADHTVITLFTFLAKSATGYHMSDEQALRVGGMFLAVAIIVLLIVRVPWEEVLHRLHLGR